MTQSGRARGVAAPKAFGVALIVPHDSAHLKKCEDHQVFARLPRGTEHWALPCAGSGDVLRRSCWFSAVKLRRPHRLQVALLKGSEAVSYLENSPRQRWRKFDNSPAFLTLGLMRNRKWSPVRDERNPLSSRWDSAKRNA